MSLVDATEPTPGMSEGSVLTLYDYARDLLSACHQALLTTEGGAIARRYVLPGPSPSLDCATLAVGLPTITLVPNSNAAVFATGMGHRFARVNQASFPVYIARDCIPVTRSVTNPQAPTPTQLEVMARLLAQDIAAIWSIIPRLQNANQLFGGPCSEVYVENATPLTIQGMVGGYLLTVRASFPGIDSEPTS